MNGQNGFFFGRSPVRTNDVGWRTNDVGWRTNDVGWREHGVLHLEHQAGSTDCWVRKLGKADFPVSTAQRFVFSKKRIPVQWNHGKDPREKQRKACKEVLWLIAAQERTGEKLMTSTTS